ncbi:MAG TPA: rhombosortase [Chthoniobacteraceae bacterium]|jgi:rhomboid family GlyGly-CTERM serine protease|nr:rhombosortase [Chthoniobacteraceae bacterium]
MQTMTLHAARGPSPRAERREIRAELLGLTVVLVLLNLPLFLGGSTSALAFRADAVAAGEWWRVFTHPFVHVSWYHLLLDGAAFLALYANLLAPTRGRRLAATAVCAAGSLLVALCVSPLIGRLGLCGLSGAGHGLLAFSALEVLAMPGADRATRRFALASLAGVGIKAIYELVTGQSFFPGLQFGLLGTPIVACHAGGVLGGLVAWAYFNLGVAVAVPAPRKSQRRCVKGRAR